MPILPVEEEIDVGKKIKQKLKNLQWFRNENEMLLGDLKERINKFVNQVVDNATGDESGIQGFLETNFEDGTGWFVEGSLLGDVKTMIDEIGKSNTKDQLVTSLVKFAEKYNKVDAIKALDLVDFFYTYSDDAETIEVAETPEEQTTKTKLKDWIQKKFPKAVGYYKKFKDNNAIFDAIKTAASPMYMWGKYEGIIQNILSSFAGSYTLNCLLGLLPIYHAQQIEVAHSGRVLKFRATGSVFLAQQEGGKDAIRIDGILLPDELPLLVLMWLTYLYTSGDVEELDNTVEGDYSTVWGLNELRKKLSTAKAYRSDIQKASHVEYKTVPFISKNVIIPNVYIETVSFEDRIVDGRNILKYSILCRTYEKPQQIQIFEHSRGNSDLRFIAQKDTWKSKFNMITVYTMNLIRRTVQSLGLFINEREWKGRMYQDESTYYDVDAADMAITTTLGAAGIAGGLM